MKASGEPRTGSARNSCPDQIGSSGMRILLVVHQFFPEFAGGTEVLTRSVAHSLARRGHEISILAASPTSEAPSDESRHDTYNFEGLLVHRFRHAYTRAVGQSSMMEKWTGGWDCGTSERRTTTRRPERAAYCLIA